MKRFFPLILIAVLAVNSTIRLAVADDRDRFLEAVSRRVAEFPAFEIKWSVSASCPDRPDDGVNHFTATMEGNRIRLVRNAVSVWDAVLHKPVNMTHEFSDDGDTQLRFVHSFSQEGNPTGTVSQRQRLAPETLSNYAVLPVLLFFRPLSAHLHNINLSTADFEATSEGRFRLGQGMPPHGMSFASTAPYQLNEWWYPEPMPIRGSTFRAEIECAPASEAGVSDDSDAFIPVAWTVIRTGVEGEVKEVHSARVTSFAATVRPDDRVFRIEFPEGTPIINGDDPEHYFVVREDGSFRPVSANDHANYDSWLEMARAPLDPEVAARDPRVQLRRFWIRTLGMVAALSLLIIYLLRRRSHRKGL